MGRTTCQLATDSTFAVVANIGAGWTYEPKLDGHRVLVSGAGCWTRSGRAIDLPHIQAACPAGVVLDCELVTATGRSTASRVQSAIRSGRVHDLHAVAFDVLSVDGGDECRRPHRERRAILESMTLSGPLSLMPSYSDPVEAMEASDEGIIAKRGDAAYTFGRSRDWLKAKWQYHRNGSAVDWLHDEIDWDAVEAGSLIVTRTTARVYG